MWGWLLKLIGRADIPRPVIAEPTRGPVLADRHEDRLRSGQSEQMLELFRDVHSTVREGARASLRERGAGAVRTLCRGLEHQDPQVGCAAAELLAELRHPDSVGPLIVALKYATRPVQLAAHRALERLGEPAITALEALRGEPQPWVRRHIEEILAVLRKDAARSV